METTLIFAEIFALLCLSALSIYLIVVLIRLRSVLMNLERDLREFAGQAIPVLENIEVITTKFRNVAANIEHEIGSIRDSMSSVKQIAQNVADFERRVQEQIEAPVMDTVAAVAALFKGVRAFLERLRT